MKQTDQKFPTIISMHPDGLMETLMEALNKSKKEVIGLLQKNVVKMKMSGAVEKDDIHVSEIMVEDKHFIIIGEKSELNKK